MAIHINSNMAASRAIADYSRVNRDSEARRARLSSGLAVNSARDSGARLSISEGMRAEIGGLTEGSRNAEQALDLLRTAEGAMSEVSNVLIRMRELAVQSSTTTLNDVNREALEAEFNQLKETVDRIAHSTTYNDQALLYGFGNGVASAATTALTDSADTGVKYIKVTGALEGTYTFIDTAGDNSITLGNGVVTQTVELGSQTVGDANQVATGTTLVANFDRLGVQVELAGADVAGMKGSYVDGDLNGKTLAIEATSGSFQLGSDAVPADRLEYDITDLTTSGSVIDLALDSIATRDNARSSIARVDEAINRVIKVRGEVGAVINRLEYTVNFTSNALERVNASESTVRDADFAWESSKLARNKILEDTSTAVLLQAQIPINMVMGLLQ